LHFSFINTVKKLQDTLRKQPNITYRRLLHTVDSILASYYEEIQKQEPNAWRATALLYKIAISPSIEEALGAERQVNSRHTLLQSLAYKNSDEEAFERERTQTIQEAMEEWISQLVLAEQETSGQKSVVGYLEKLYLIEHLTLTNDSLLSRIHLSELVKKFPHLKHITLRHCHQLNVDAVLVTVLENPQLALTIEDCHLIASAKEWARLAERCQKLTLIIQGQAYSLQSDSAEVLLQRYQESGVQSSALKEFLEIRAARVRGERPDAPRAERQSPMPLTRFFAKAASKSSSSTHSQQVRLF
jgi:hypothetical protein